MFPRLLASFLALVVLWSGFAGWEQWAASADDLVHSAALLPGSPLDDGSVADHHLDDQPAQSPFDAGGGALAVLPSQWRTAAADAGSQAPPTMTQRVPDAPFLEGLRRPPRSA
jgi:hypothetical protein